MPIENVGGVTVCTGKGIELYRLVAMKQRVRLEGNGLKGRINTTAALMAEFCIPGKATAKNRAKLLDAMEAKIAELQASVALENMALTGENN